MTELIIIVLLILCNGLLSMSELALISVRKSALEQDIKRGSKSAKIALKLSRDPDKFLSTVQIGITVIGILTGIYSGNVLANNFAEFLRSLGIPTWYDEVLSKTIIVVLVTYFTIIFGELVPKRIGLSVAESVAKIMARPMYLFSSLTAPFVSVLSRSTAFVFNLLGLKSEEGKVTTAEIMSMLAEGRKGGEVEEVEQNIVERVFLLGDLKVSSLMTHRSDVMCMDASMCGAELKELIKARLYKFYPVVEKSMDTVRGIVSLNDIVFRLDDEDFSLMDYVKEAVYFHENMSFYKVFEQMKERHISYALICDEFGSCVGVITLKDVLEGLVGAMDEKDVSLEIVKRKDGEGWLVDGQCPFHDFISYFDLEHLYDDPGYSTLGGLILNKLEHIPQEGESVEWESFRFEILDMDGVRIDKILVSRLPEEPEPDA